MTDPQLDAGVSEGRVGEWFLMKVGIISIHTGLLNPSQRGCNEGWGCLFPFFSPQVRAAASQAPSPWSLRVPASVCESGSWSGFRRMFFLAGPFGAGGGRGPSRGLGLNVWGGDRTGALCQYLPGVGGGCHSGGRRGGDSLVLY